MTIPGLLFPENPRCVAFMGDWHGHAQWAVRMIRVAALHGADTIIHVGDFGFDRPNPISNKYLSAVNRTLKGTDLTLLVVDGNHEHHEWLNTLPVNDIGVRPVTKNIAHLPRGFRWGWHNKTWMSLGGAHSVNSHLLTPGHNWFPEEWVSPEEMSSAMEVGSVDVMVTHDIPDRVQMEGHRDSELFPAYQIERARQHSALIGTVVDETRPSWLFHGHMHFAHITERELIDGGGTTVVGMDCNGAAHWSKNMVLFDAETLELLPMDLSLEF